MPTQYRALVDDFRLWMDERHAWPLVKNLKKSTAGGIRTATIKDMKGGAIVAERCILALIDLLRGKPALDAYLTGLGHPESGKLTTDQILDLIAGAPASKSAPAPDGKDWFLMGLDGLREVLDDILFGKEPVPDAARCHSEDDARSASAMMMSTVGRRVQRGRKSSSPEEAIRRAERHMKISREDYESRDIELWRAVPWTIVFAVVNGRRIGCSRVLPLKKSAYLAFRNGLRSTHTCAGGDLAFPSRYLLIENAGELPDSEFPSANKRTMQQLRAICLQLARLSLFEHRQDGARKQRLHILSFAGTQVNRRRLLRFGFRPNGNRMPDTGVEMLELDRRKGWLLLLLVRQMRRRLRKLNIM